MAFYRSYWSQSSFICGFMEVARSKNWRLKTLAMEVDSTRKNPQDEEEEIFLKLEEQVIDISHNMDLLMESLENFKHLRRLVSITQKLDQMRNWEIMKTQKMS
jgi:hypothetical protein